MSIWLSAIEFSVIPVTATIIGAAIAAFRPPGAKLRSVLQHFAAGVVFSVVAVELLPDVMKEHNAVAASIGFASGVILMLGIKKLTGGKTKSEVSGNNGKFSENSAEKMGEVSFSILTGIGIDLLIDGFLLGIGFAAGAKEGKLLAFALTVELLSLGLALASSLRQKNVPSLKVIIITALLSLLIFIGTFIGATVLQQVSAETLEAVLSFGLAALLFIVTEELLTEAHEEPETPLITATFFAGFLLFLILGMVG